MSIFQQFVPFPGIRAGVWHITETEEELKRQTRLSEAEKVRLDTFRNEGRRRQWLAVRVLLQGMLPELNAEITYDVAGRPFLLPAGPYISISHSGEFAAITLGDHVSGIDIEKVRDRITRVRDRFLSSEEAADACRGNMLEPLCIYWGGKEAIYKIAGVQGTDLKNDIHIHPFDYLCNTNGYCDATLVSNGFPGKHRLYYCHIPDYIMVVAE